MEFLLGDKVAIDEEFDGSITVAGWDRDDIEDCIFEVVSFEEFQKCRPKFAQKVKHGPTKKDVFLKCIEPELDDNVFVLYPSTALTVVEQANQVCRCPIKRLWGGLGHYTGCAEA